MNRPILIYIYTIPGTIANFPDILIVYYLLEIISPKASPLWLGTYLSSSNNQLVVGGIPYFTNSIESYIHNTRNDAQLVATYYLSRTGSTQPDTLQNNKVWPPLDDWCHRHLADWTK